MSELKVGDKVKVKDRPGWPGGYKIANWEGVIVEVKEDPADYVIMKADKTILPWKIFNYLKKGFSLMDEAVELDPDEPEIRLIRASTCTLLPKFLGKRKIAFEDFKHIQNLDNLVKQELTNRFWLPFYYYYGLVLAAEEKLIAAEEKFLKVLDIDPQSSYARRSEKELEKIYFSAK